MKGDRARTNVPQQTRIAFAGPAAPAAGNMPMSRGIGPRGVGEEAKGMRIRSVAYKLAWLAALAVAVGASWRS